MVDGGSQLSDNESCLAGGIGIPFHMSIVKRLFDVSVSLFGLLACCWVIVIAIIAARRDTGLSGLFRQRRIGLHGREFEILKIRTMRNIDEVDTTVTSADDPRITRLGKIFRRTKIDELPQLWNVLKGDMSFVGPRPDVPGFVDQLQEDARILLSVRPGITGPATLRFRNEEEILAGVDDPEKYNYEVVFPEKVRLNMDYIRNYSFFNDLKYLAKSLLG